MHVEMGAGQRPVPKGAAVLQRDGPLRQFLGPAQGMMPSFGRPFGFVLGDMAYRQARQGGGQRRVELQRPVEQPAGLHHVITAASFQSMPGAEQIVVGRHVLGWLGFRPQAARILHLPGKRGHDVRRDVILDRQQVAGVAVVFLGPQVPPVPGVGQLHRHPHPAVRPLNRPFQNMRHAKALARPTGIDIRAVQCEGGGAGNHEQVVEPGQAGQDVIRDSFREITAPAPVRKRQNRYRRPVRKRQIDRFAEGGGARGPVSVRPATPNFVEQRDGLGFRFHLQFAAKKLAARLILLQRHAKPALRRIGPHQGPVGRFLQGVDRQQPQRRVQTPVQVGRRLVFLNQFQRGANGQHAQPLALSPQPVVEVDFVKVQPVQEIAPVQVHRPFQRFRPALAQQ